MRQTIKEIQTNVAYRWYLGYSLEEEIPHFSTFGKNYSRRFQNTDLFEQIFQRVIAEIMEYGFIDPESIFIDGTHIKASANNHKSEKETIAESVKYYENELIKEINEDRFERGKKACKKKTEVEEKTKVVKKSTVDPDCGVFHKGKHKVVFAYATNVACDRNNYILGFHTEPGNVNDSVAFPKIYEKVKAYDGVKNIVMDAGYKTPAIARQVLNDKRIPVLPYKRPMTKDGFFKKYEYVYDEYYDCYVCPSNQVLKYSTTNKEGYREYKSKGEICKDCPYLSQCTASKDHVKLVNRHIWENYLEQCEDIRHTPKYKEIYKLRSQTIERVFADAKEKHKMRYTQYRGIQKMEMELNLLFASMNLKKLATWINKIGKEQETA